MASLARQVPVVEYRPLLQGGVWFPVRVGEELEALQQLQELEGLEELQQFRMPLSAAEAGVLGTEADHPSAPRVRLEAVTGLRSPSLAGAFLLDEGAVLLFASLLCFMISLKELSVVLPHPLLCMFAGSGVLACVGWAVRLVAALSWCSLERA